MIKIRQPDIVLCDIRMPKKEGIEVIKIITRQYSKTKIIAFTMFDQDEVVEQMLHAGASRLSNKGYQVL